MNIKEEIKSRAALVLWIILGTGVLLFIAQAAGGRTGDFLIGLISSFWVGAGAAIVFFGIFGIVFPAIGKGKEAIKKSIRKKFGGK